MTHGTARCYWRGCRWLVCRAAYSVYWNEGRRRRLNGELKLVSVDWAKRQLELFPNTRAAAKATGIGQATIVRILNGTSKHIRVETERKILRAA